MKNIIIAISFIFIFNACSSKSPEKNELSNKNTQINTSVQKEEEDDFSKKFDEEFADEFAQDETKEETYDPFNSYNRAMTSFNDFMILNIVNPLAKGYVFVVPENARIGISNLFDNLLFPVRFTNNILQLKFANASEEFARFTINSTFGAFGLFDAAKYSFGLQEHKEDFGQTLGFYGVGSGPHIVLPIFGPSNLRDIFGLGADFYLDPTSNTASNTLSYKIPDNLIESTSLSTFRQINSASLRLGQYENLRKDALDLYPFLRDIYEQSRKKAIEE